MVLLAAAICTKTGKALVSRQFVEMTRARIEGLLASFPKLIGSSSGSSSKQHTFVETESVRYVYQPIDKLYMLLITTKASNILEDLETLRLFSRVIPEYCRTVDEKEINEHCFELLFAFDEIVALGYRENVNLAQIRTFTDMESHEEKVYKAMRETQEKEAKQKMLEKAEEIRRSKVLSDKLHKSMGGMGSSGSSGGFGGISSSSYSSSSHTIEPSAFESSLPPSFGASSSYSSSSSSSKPNRAMKLGTSKDALPAFIEQQVRQAIPNSSTAQGSTAAGSASTSGPTSSASTHDVHVEKVHVKVDEKISLSCGKDGGVHNLEVLGVISLRIASEEEGRVRVAIINNDNRNLNLQTNPNIDKNLFKTNSIIGLRDPTKNFPIGNDVGVLKWRFQSQDESEIPLTINCWPSETKNGCDVSIEYELQKLNLELNNVTIIVPIPSGSSAPIVKTCDGDYTYERFKNMLIWRIDMIDQSNSTGTFEFSIQSTSNAVRAGDFFPVNVNFVSRNSYCDIAVVGVTSAENPSIPVKNSVDVNFSVDKYEIA